MNKQGETRTMTRKIIAFTIFLHVFFKKGVFKNLAKFTRKHLSRFKKVAGYLQTAASELY